MLSDETMTSRPHSIETPKTMASPARALRSAVELGRRARIATTRFGRFDKHETALKGESATLRTESLLTAWRAISLALSPEVHSTGLGPSHCRLCGSTCGPRATHLCARLYGR
jgi:hypothetical protein